MALYALTLAEYGPEGIDVAKALKMLLLHDLVEIDAGDHPIHGKVDHAAKEAAEAKAADRIFGLLPADQAAAFRAIWDEFEAAATPEAQFAKAMDRAVPPVQNLENGGGNWAEYNVALADIDRRVGPPIKRGAPAIWDWLRPRLDRFFASR